MRCTQLCGAALCADSVQRSRGVRRADSTNGSSCVASMSGCIARARLHCFMVPAFVLGTIRAQSASSMLRAACGTCNMTRARRAQMCARTRRVRRSAYLALVRATRQGSTRSRVLVHAMRGMVSCCCATGVECAWWLARCGVCCPCVLLQRAFGTRCPCTLMLQLRSAPATLEVECGACAALRARRARSRVCMRRFKRATRLFATAALPDWHPLVAIRVLLLCRRAPDRSAPCMTRAAPCLRRVMAHVARVRSVAALSRLRPPGRRSRARCRSQHHHSSFASLCLVPVPKASS